MKCILCGKKIIGYGNNALPIIDGKCCDDCNRIVIVHRQGIMWYHKMGEDEKAKTKALLDKHNPPATIGAIAVIYDMKGEENYSGKSGVIQHIDDLGQLHGTWGGCALIPETDVYAIINTEALHLWADQKR